MITKFGDDNNLFFLFWEICSQVGKFIQCVSCLLGGLVVAFIKGWLLALVLLSSIPLLLLSGSIMSFVFAMTASRGQAAYSEAATIVERIIGSIRTVCKPTPSIKNFPLFFFLMFLTKDTQQITPMCAGCFIYRRKASYSSVQSILN
jgi:ATP-binding cassette subfamily B (MDR/TAP) protein 1